MDLSPNSVKSVQISCSVVSDSLWPHGLQHARPPCPAPTPGIYSNSYPLSWWCHPTIWSSVVPFSSHLLSFPASGSSKESVLCIRWPKYRSFSLSISPSNEYSELISFRMEWLDLVHWRMWSTGEGNGKPLQYSCLENPMNSMKRQNDRILKEELPRLVGA